MAAKRFDKSYCRKIFILFSVITFIISVLLTIGGCEKSDYEKTLSGENIPAVTQPSDTAPNSTNSVTTEKPTVTEVTDSSTDVSNILELNKKSLKIKALGAFHSSLNSWSGQLNINKSTGESSGYIFISYVEASLDGGSTEINTSVLKANLKGTIDMKTLDFKGFVTGDIVADRDDFFFGTIDLETTGNLSADYSQFTGTFTTPSLVIFDYVLERE